MPNRRQLVLEPVRLGQWVDKVNLWEPDEIRASEVSKRLTICTFMIVMVIVIVIF